MSASKAWVLHVGRSPGHSRLPAHIHQSQSHYSTRHHCWSHHHPSHCRKTKFTRSSKAPLTPSLILSLRFFVTKINCPPQTTPQSQPMMKWVMSLMNLLTLTVMIPWHYKMWTCLECQFFSCYSACIMCTIPAARVSYIRMCVTAISLTFHDFGIIWRNLRCSP